MHFDFSLFRIGFWRSSFIIFIGSLAINNYNGSLLYFYISMDKWNRDFDWDFLFLHTLFKRIMLKIRKDHNED